MNHPLARCIFTTEWWWNIVYKSFLSFCIPFDIYNLCESFKSNFNRGRMGRLWKKMKENILTENDFIFLAKCYYVSVYRKEQFKNFDTITFRCSQYRRFTKCQYQVKVKVFHDGIYQVFSFNK